MEDECLDVQNFCQRSHVAGPAIPSPPPLFSPLVYSFFPFLLSSLLLSSDSLRFVLLLRVRLSCDYG